MLINWFTVFAQILNFLILVYLLQRFLYGPLLRVMAEREKKIASRLQEAETARDEARQQAAALDRDRQEFQAVREKLLDEARLEVEHWRVQALARAGEEVRDKQSAWQEALAGEQDDFLRRLKLDISRQLFKAADKVLRDLADASLESRLIEVFLVRIKEAAIVLPATVGTGKTVEVRTGLSLAPEQRARLQDGIAAIFPGIAVRFTENIELGFGLSLRSGDSKVDWNLADYLQEMETAVLQSMKTSAGVDTHGSAIA